MHTKHIGNKCFACIDLVFFVLVQISFGLGVIFKIMAWFDEYFVGYSFLYIYQLLALNYWGFTAFLNLMRFLKH